MEEAEPLINSKHRPPGRLDRLLTIRQGFFSDHRRSSPLLPPSPASIVKEKILYGTPAPSPLLLRSVSVGAIQSTPKPDDIATIRSLSFKRPVTELHEGNDNDGDGLQNWPSTHNDDSCSHVVDLEKERGADTGSCKLRNKMHRSNSAPAIVVESSAKMAATAGERPQLRSASEAVKQAFIGVVIYLCIGVSFYMWRVEEFKGGSTYSVVDALYFCIVTMCTIGYGDIVPCTTFTKMLCCAFILVGFGFIDILLSGLLTFVLDKQETVLIHSTRYDLAKAYFVDVEKGRMRIRIKVGLALGVVVLCIGIGTLVVHGVEKLSWADSFYLAVTSATTVGFGDYAFETTEGRLFAVVWLLVSTLAVARAFLYLAELRIDKRTRLLAKWILHRDMTVADLLAADLDNNGVVTKSEYVIYKLKEMGKVEEKDIVEIVKQFNRLDTDNCGKITLSLLSDH